MLAKNKVRHPSLPLLWLRNIGAITQNISVTYFPRFNVFYFYFCDNCGNRTSCVSFVGTNVVGSVVFQLIQIVCHRNVNDQNSRRIFIFVTWHRRCEWPKNWYPFFLLYFRQRQLKWKFWLAPDFISSTPYVSHYNLTSGGL